MMADDGWVDVAQPKAPAADDGWVNVGAPKEQASPSDPFSQPAFNEGGYSAAGMDLIKSTTIGGVMTAFGQGFREASGPEPLGLSPDSVKALSKLGIFAPEGQKQFQNPFHAFNEGIILPAAAALDGAIRTFNGTYRGLQAAGIAAGLPNDVVSLPDAFAGSPGALGEIRMRSGLPHDQPVGRSEPSPQIIDTPAGPVAAPPGLTAYHGSPHDFEAFSTQHIGTGEGAQSYGHGLYFAENEGVAGEYAEKLGKGEGTLYQVRISADQSKMLDWDASYSEQPDAVKAVFAPLAEQFGENSKIESLIKIMSSRGDGMKGVSEALSDAGVPGIKYLDQGSRIPMMRLADEIPRWKASMAKAQSELEKATERGENPRNIAEYERELDRTKQGLQRAEGHLSESTSNFVIFNEGDIHITHKNGEPIVTPEMRMAQANDMGVIGPERQPISDGTPAEAAQRTIAANAKPGEKVTQEVGGEPNPWRERFDQFVGKITTGDDVKQLITDAADQNGEFPAARAGDIPLKQFGDITEAAGVDLATVDRSGVGRLLQNDNQVRNAMQGMLTATENVRDAAREVKADPSEANLMKLQESMLRRDTWVEQVVGHRAEWGRTGNVFQEFLAKSKEEGGFTQFLKDQDRSPEGLKKLANAIDNLDPAQAAKLLSDANKPTFWDKFKFYWVNALISGPVTHAKYIVANGAFAAYEAAIVTPVAGGIGAIRRGLAKIGAEDYKPAFRDAADNSLHTAQKGEDHAAIAERVGIAENSNQFERGYTDSKGQFHSEHDVQQKIAEQEAKEREGVFAGEAAAKTWGLVAGVPDALKAAVQAAKTGLQTPLPGELAQGIVPKRNQNVAYQQRPISGTLGAVIGVPSKGASAIHSFFNFLGYRASIEAQAYRAAIKDGYSPTPSGPPPVAPGSVRFYHGTAYKDASGFFGSTFVSPYENYARNYHGSNNNVLYTDLTKAEAMAEGLWDDINDKPRNGSIQNGSQRLKPLEPETTSDSFWQRRQALADRPTEEMMNSAIEDGYRLTYISELGDTGKKLSAFVNSTKPGQLIMPFTHIPLNILKRAAEGTPAAWLDKETRDAMTGKAGAAKQDMAIARMVTGGAVGAWAINQVLNERMTGFGPTDPKERAEWMAAGHQPYSIRIGDEWLSFNRFGSLGTMLGLYANLAEVIPHMKPDAEELTKAIGMTVHSTGRLMEDEVGMQGLSNLMQAIDQPDRSGSRYVANFTGSLLPYSSLLRQVASSMDPSMREAKTVVDGLRYYIPVARQGLLPKRDWSGTPIANAGYGGDLPVPGLSSVIQHRSAVADPVALELAALDIKPAPPQDRIKGVKLPPQLYDIYQSTAGPFTKTALENYVNTPGWHDLPIGVRADIFRSTIRATREAAGAAMQMRYPQLIQQGVEDRVNRINGGKPGKLQDISAP